MHTWDVFYEDADSDEPRRWIGTIQADSASLALELAAQYYEIPSYNLTVELVK